MIDIKSGSSAIRVEKKEFKGKKYIDIRKYYRDRESEKQELLPTKKGIFIPIDLVDKVIKAIKKSL